MPITPFTPSLYYVPSTVTSTTPTSILEEPQPMPIQAPMTNRTLGFEFEHVSKLSHAQMADRLARVRLPVDVEATGHAHNPLGVYTGWQSKADNSITRTNDFPTGIELVSPPLPFQELARQTRVALALAREFGGVNSSSGLHVHVAVPELRGAIRESSATRDYRNRLTQLWQSVEQVFFSYVPPSRRRNDYCRPGINWTNRYQALNLTPLGDNRGTIEFRLHSATLNPNKALAFALLCSKFCDFIVQESNLIAPAIDPGLTEDVAPRHTKTKSNEFRIQRINKKWVIEAAKREREFESLTQAYNELKSDLQFPDNVSPLRAFHYPTFGNAMTRLCNELKLHGPFRGYLEARYERMIEKFGVANTTGPSHSLSQDEANYYEEEEWVDEPTASTRGRFD